MGVSGNSLLIRVGAAGDESVFTQSSDAFAASSEPAADDLKVVNVDFRRGTLGEGQIQIAVNDPSASASIRREDVTDFSTPVRNVDAKKDGSSTQIVIEPNT